MASQEKRPGGHRSLEYLSNELKLFSRLNWSSSSRRITLTLPLRSTSGVINRTKRVAQRLKRLPPMRETQVRSLGREDPLEKEKATHSSILDWRIPWIEEPGGL